MVQAGSHGWYDERGGRVVLRGRLDVVSVPDVRLLLHAAVDRGCGDLVIDLSGVEVIDSTGLGVLVGAHRRAGRCDRRLVLSNVPPRIGRLLALTRLHRVLCLDEPVAVA